MNNAGDEHVNRIDKIYKELFDNLKALEMESDLFGKPFGLMRNVT